MIDDEVKSLKSKQKELTEQKVHLEEEKNKLTEQKNDIITKLEEKIQEMVGVPDRMSCFVERDILINQLNDINAQLIQISNDICLIEDSINSISNRINELERRKIEAKEKLAKIPIDVRKTIEEIREKIRETMGQVQTIRCPRVVRDSEANEQRKMKFSEQVSKELEVLIKYIVSCFEKLFLVKIYYDEEFINDNILIKMWEYSQNAKHKELIIIRTIINKILNDIFGEKNGILIRDMIQTTYITDEQAIRFFDDLLKAIELKYPQEPHKYDPIGVCGVGESTLQMREATNVESFIERRNFIEWVNNNFHDNKKGAMFLKAVIEGQELTEIAKEYNMSRQRVSYIVKEIRKYIEGEKPCDFDKEILLKD